MDEDEDVKGTVKGISTGSFDLRQSPVTPGPVSSNLSQGPDGLVTEVDGVPIDTSVRTPSPTPKDLESSQWRRWESPGT